MKRVAHGIVVFVLASQTAACVSGSVKTAVGAYAIAVDQVAESGQADLVQCQSQQDATLRQQFCDKTKKQFQAIRDSAAQLKAVAQ